MNIQPTAEPSRADISSPTPNSILQELSFYEPIKNLTDIRKRRQAMNISIDLDELTNATLAIFNQTQNYTTSAQIPTQNFTTSTQIPSNIKKYLSSDNLPVKNIKTDQEEKYGNTKTNLVETYTKKQTGRDTVTAYVPKEYDELIAKLLKDLRDKLLHHHKNEQEQSERSMTSESESGKAASQVVDELTRMVWIPMFSDTHGGKQKMQSANNVELATQNNTNFSSTAAPVSIEGRKYDIKPFKTSQASVESTTVSSQEAQTATIPKLVKLNSRLENVVQISDSVNVQPLQDFYKKGQRNYRTGKINVNEVGPMETEETKNAQEEQKMALIIPENNTDTILEKSTVNPTTDEIQYVENGINQSNQPTEKDWVWLKDLMDNSANRAIDWAWLLQTLSLLSLDNNLSADMKSITTRGKKLVAERSDSSQESQDEDYLEYQDHLGNIIDHDSNGLESVKETDEYDLDDLLDHNKDLDSHDYKDSVEDNDKEKSEMEDDDYFDDNNSYDYGSNQNGTEEGDQSSHEIDNPDYIASSEKRQDPDSTSEEHHYIQSLEDTSKEDMDLEDDNKQNMYGIVNNPNDNHSPGPVSNIANNHNYYEANNDENNQKSYYYDDSEGDESIADSHEYEQDTHSIEEPDESEEEIRNKFIGKYQENEIDESDNNSENRDDTFNNWINSQRHNDVANQLGNHFIQRDEYHQSRPVYQQSMKHRRKIQRFPQLSNMHLTRKFKRSMLYKSYNNKILERRKRQTPAITQQAAKFWDQFINNIFNPMSQGSPGQTGSGPMQSNVHPPSFRENQNSFALAQPPLADQMFHPHLNSNQQTDFMSQHSADLISNNHLKTTFDHHQSDPLLRPSFDGGANPSFYNHPMQPKLGHSQQRTQNGNPFDGFIHKSHPRSPPRVKESNMFNRHSAQFTRGIKPMRTFYNPMPSYPNYLTHLGLRGVGHSPFSYNAMRGRGLFGVNNGGYEPGETQEMASDMEEILTNLFQRYWENVRTMFSKPPPLDSEAEEAKPVTAKKGNSQKILSTETTSLPTNKNSIPSSLFTSLGSTFNNHPSTLNPMTSSSFQTQQSSNMKLSTPAPFPSNFVSMSKQTTVITNSKTELSPSKPTQKTTSNTLPPKPKNRIGYMLPRPRVLG